MTDWAPATEAEVAMRDALRADDQELYFRILARVELLLPISSEAIAGRVPMGWGTWTASGRTHVLAFTSSEAMHACLAEHAGSARKIPYYELAAAWPNVEWWLAVNPGLPIEGYLPSWFISQLARGDARLPGQPQLGTAVARAALPRRDESLGRARGSASLPRRTLTAAVETAPPGGQLPSRSESGVPSQGAASQGAPSQDAPSQGAWDQGAREHGARDHSALDLGAPPRDHGAPPAGGAPPIAPPTSGSEPVTPASGEPTTSAPPALPRRVPDQSGTIPPPPPGSSIVPPPPHPEPSLEPANEIESQLLSAVKAGRMDHFLSTLLLAKVLLPVAAGADPRTRPGEPGFVWRTEKLEDQGGDQPYVVVFTSSQRLSEQLGAGVPAIDIRFVQLIRSWPDQSWALSVNPGTPIAMALPSSQIARLASSVEEVGLGDDAGVAGESGASQIAARSTIDPPVPMQKVIAPSQVSWYLERSYDRVCGFVHREQEVAHLRTPEKLISGLGLRYEGSPFAADTTEVYVLRWPAHRPALYRIPYGGRTEAAMAAMEGWVIERPPFRGNGFAPAETDDVIAEFKVDSVRLPHGAQLWRLSASGQSQLVALLDADGPTWQMVEESPDA